jgi:hypothetical protein
MSTRRSIRVATRLTTIGAIALVWLGLTPAALTAGQARTIVVTTVPELQAALTPGNAGARIVVRAGDYEVPEALTVPDRATLVGEGVMMFDETGLPTGFKASGRTAIRGAASLVGDILALGDGATLKFLAVEDAAGRTSGNPVVVVSRAAADSVSARITECEIVNPNPSGIIPSGPTGRALVVMVRNPNLGQDPPPHEGSTLRVTMERSIVRSPGAGFGVFAINFASDSEIGLELRRNVIGGGLSATGGVGRPDAVSGSAVSIQSSHNLYRSDSADQAPSGWSLLAGADAPSPILVSGASTSNSLQIHSKDDRIEGFATGISAAGGRRFSPVSGPISSNTVEMRLHGTRLQSTAADLTLFGELSFVDGVLPDDDNALHFSLRQAIGSGPRSNQYANSTSPSGAEVGTGNELEIAGTPQGFDRSNDNVEPPPPAEFFAACQ